MFKEVADIKTADMLELPVPEAHFHNVAVKPSEMQKEMVASLAERAEKVRGGGVDSSLDNMLKITNDGRKLALDQRMLNDMLPDFEEFRKAGFRSVTRSLRGKLNRSYCLSKGTCPRVEVLQVVFYKRVVLQVSLNGIEFHHTV